MRWLTVLFMGIFLTGCASLANQQIREVSALIEDPIVSGYVAAYHRVNHKCPAAVDEIRQIAGSEEGRQKPLSRISGLSAASDGCVIQMAGPSFSDPSAKFYRIKIVPPEDKGGSYKGYYLHGYSDSINDNPDFELKQ